MSIHSFSKLKVLTENNDIKYNVIMFIKNSLTIKKYSPLVAASLQGNIDIPNINAIPQNVNPLEHRKLVLFLLFSIVKELKN